MKFVKLSNGTYINRDLVQTARVEGGQNAWYAVFMFASEEATSVQFTTERRALQEIERVTTEQSNVIPLTHADLEEIKFNG